MPSTQYGANWQRGGSGVNTFEEKLPSGEVVLLKRATPEDLIMAGVVDDLDLLTKFVDKEVVQPGTTGLKPGAAISPSDFATFSELFKDKEALLKIMVLADRVAVQCCVQPKLKLAPPDKCASCGWEGADPTQHQPEDGHDPEWVPRDDRFVYTDVIDFMDKIAIMNAAVGGADTLESFRGELEADVANVAAVQDVQLPAVGAGESVGPATSVDV